MSYSRATAVSRLRSVVEAVETGPMPVPVREVWAFGDVVLGADPIDRLRVYLTKDLLFKDAPEREAEFEAELGVGGVGKTVSAAWAEDFPDRVRANANGHAAPERCLAAHLFEPDEPVHLEVCNTGFENNVRQRLKGALAREDYTQLLDPRAACLWVDTDDGGRTSEEAFRKLAGGEFVFPTLSAAFESLGMDPDQAARAAEALRAHRNDETGVSVRGDVV
ncbi:DUF7095 family protein [Natronomonas sp.]|uniref:DUF7095 family protein n=1 Tax=Natronomonas sp. TaxID=2184060 RepID=UPI00261543ED|nr:hypothetical protein [Natronomonas sp.]